MGEKGRTCTTRGREGTFRMDCPIRGAKQPLDEVRRRFVLRLELCWRSTGYAPKYVGPTLFYTYFTRWRGEPLEIALVLIPGWCCSILFNRDRT
jgi:hypothetical protein